jgi:hypothetical protein
MTAQTHGAAIFMRAAVYLEALISGIDSTSCGITKTHTLKEPFRSADCEGGYAQFKDWPKPERDVDRSNIDAGGFHVRHAPNRFGFNSVTLFC